MQIPATPTRVPESTNCYVLAVRGAIGKMRVRRMIYICMNGHIGEHYAYLVMPVPFASFVVLSWEKRIVQ